MNPRDQALQRALGGDDESLLTLEELAEDSGLSLNLLEALEREGLLVSRDDDDRVYHPADAEAVRAGLDLVSAGLPLAELLAVARMADDAMRPVAIEAVNTFVRFVSDPVEGSSESDDEIAQRLTDAFEKMLPATGRLVAHHFQRLLVESARQRVSDRPTDPPPR